MDSLSNLLQEARPMYLQRKYKRRQHVNYCCLAICSLLAITPVVIDIKNNQHDIKSVYTELYTEYTTNNPSTYYIDEFDIMGVI